MVTDWEVHTTSRRLLFEPPGYHGASIQTDPLPPTPIETSPPSGLKKASNPTRTTDQPLVIARQGAHIGTYGRLS